MINLINTVNNFSFTNEISLNNDRTACNPFNAKIIIWVIIFNSVHKYLNLPLWGSFKPVRPTEDPQKAFVIIYLE